MSLFRVSLTGRYEDSVLIIGAYHARIHIAQAAQFDVWRYDGRARNWDLVASSHTLAQSKLARVVYIRLNIVDARGHDRARHTKV